MWKQPQRLYVTPRQPEQFANGPKRVSFTSLSKNKNHPHIKSHPSTQLGPVSPKTATLRNSGKENRAINVFREQAGEDQYRLFSNIAKNKIDNDKLLYSKPILQSPTSRIKSKQQPPGEYYGTSSQHQKAPRPESRCKIQKYFSEAPALIRPKSNSSNSNLVVRGEGSSKEEANRSKEEKKNRQNYHTFPPNEYYNTWRPEDSIRTSIDAVNTSRSSIKFDMSPCFN